MSVQLQHGVLDLHVDTFGPTTHHRSRQFGTLDRRPKALGSPSPAHTSAG